MSDSKLSSAENPTAPDAAAAAAPGAAAGAEPEVNAALLAQVPADLKDAAAQLVPDFLREASDARTTAQLEELRVKFLGKKGRVTALKKGLGALSADVRPVAGKIINDEADKVVADLEARIETCKKAEALERIQAEAIDITLPGTPVRRGGLHPVTQVRREIEAIFTALGFDIAETREIEDEWHNFEALNIAADHPARDMQDTFYVDGGRVLRTHTSPTQIHSMLTRKPPLAVIGPGKVYRCDSDVTHSPMFHQLEGFLVDRNITFGHLKGTLNAFVQALFGADVATRFRPSFFPFTEPSAEVDIACLFCKQKGGGCRVCSDTGWIEVLGSGMIHPKVLENVGYDPEEWSGFAFGLGVERVTMLKYGINDIRLFYEGDLRFLSQF